MGDYLLRLLLPWLAKPRGQRFVRAFGQQGDRFREEAAYGVRQTMIEEAGADTYHAHQRNSGLPVLAQEAAAAQLATLRGRWHIARQSGGVEGILAALSRLGYAGCEVISQLDLHLVGLPGAFGGARGYFFVVIPYGQGFEPAGDWDDGAAWDDGGTWDLTEPYAGALDDLRYLIRKYKHGCSTCRFLRIYIGAGPNDYVHVPVAELHEIQRNGGRYPDHYTENF